MLLKLNDDEYNVLRILVTIPVGESATYTTRGKPSNFLLSGVSVTNDAFNWLYKHHCIVTAPYQTAHVTLTGFRTFLANVRGDDATKIWEEINGDRIQ